MCWVWFKYYFMVKWSHFPLCYFLFIVCFLSEQMSCDLKFFFLLQPSEFISVTVKNKVRETSVQMKSWNIYQLNNVGLFQSLLLSKSCSLLSEDLKVWRADPGSIFDFDPLEDNIQSKSLRRMSGSSGSSRNVFKLKYFAYLHTSLMTPHDPGFTINDF